MVKLLAEKIICREERRVFFNEWRQHPTQLGTLAPITVKLADTTAALIPNPAQAKVVEIGAGTGRLSRAILRAGVQPHNLVVVELNSRLCQFLHQCWRHAKNAPHVVEGNAIHLKDIIPADFVGQTTTVVSAIPFRYLTADIRGQIMNAAGSVLQPGGSMLHVTYHPACPAPVELGWQSRRRAALWWNLPPAFVFEFTPGQPR